jgi:hypothetical protein
MGARIQDWQPLINRVISFIKHNSFALQIKVLWPRACSA